MAEQQFTWVEFYSELADKLLPYKDNRPALIEKLHTVYSDIGMKFPKLDSSQTPVDIDPYTVFGLFNKGLSETNRKKIAEGLARAFGIEASQPSDFDGIPLVMALNATFYAFTGDKRRGEHDIDNLWRIFEAELALAEEDTEKTRAEFIAAFDSTITQFGLGWKLTMGLYWARPMRLINLDSRNRWYLGDMAGAGTVIAGIFPKEKDSPLHDGTAYLNICDTILSHLGTDECPQLSLPALSDISFKESERVNKEKKEAAKKAEQETQDNAFGDADVETTHYWLYAPGVGANMWDEFYDGGVMGLGWDELGDLSAYETKEDMRLRLQGLHPEENTSQKNSAHAVWQFAHDVKPGDIIFAKRGMSEIIGRGVVTGDYEYDEDGSEYPNLRNVDWSHKGSWKLDQKFAQKTLTDVTDYTDFVATVSALFAPTEADADDVVEDEPEAPYPTYGEDDFLAEAYMDRAQYETLVEVLRSKKNIILQGAPGVGKTFIAKRLAYSMMGVKDPDRVQMVQFHQSYSYEDFIEGYRPSKNGFELEKGAFYTFCKKAQDDDENDYFFVIDEINRGNLSKIFGELFMLIENDKRGPKNKLQLLYSHELFYVPSNVYLIGMMNTADRSLAMLDYALRRRFAFFDLKPGFDSDGFTKYRHGLRSAKLDKLVACVGRLNSAIAEDDTLGEGFCIGHSYFCGLAAEDMTDAKLSAIVEYELVPMLREYWFDDPAKVRDWASTLRKAIQ